MTSSTPFGLTRGDALIVVDLQQDFLPGGSLAVPRGDEVITPLNAYIERFSARRLPIYATRDWHPANHCSFEQQGGPWPPHCIAESAGARFARGLALPAEATIISKATSAERDAYSAFNGTDLAERLQRAGVKRVFVGGLATDYCVLNTVKDGIAAGFDVVLLLDAVRAVEVKPGDGDAAVATMRELGARTATLDHVAG